MSRPTTYELEMLNPTELGRLLHAEISRDDISPDIQYIQDLLDVGCPIEARDDFGQTPLHYAAGNGFLEIVQLLVSNGADIQAKNMWGSTPWAYAYDFIKVAVPGLEPK